MLNLSPNSSLRRSHELSRVRKPAWVAQDDLKQVQQQESSLPDFLYVGWAHIFYYIV